MKLSVRLITAAAILLASAYVLFASHMIYDPVSKSWKEVPDQSPPPREQSKSAKPKQTPSDKPKATKAKPTPVETAPKPAEREATPNPTNVLVGVWKATNLQELGNGGNLIGNYEIAIREDGTAIKTLDVTNHANGDVSFREIERKWVCKASWRRTAGSTVTIDWSEGELADWSPRAISRKEIEGYGNPNAETSVYELKGDELARTNDPNGVIYHRQNPSAAAKDVHASPNHVVIRPLKKTYIKVIVDNGATVPKIERWISPTDGSIEFRGQHFRIMVLDRDAIRVEKNGKLVSAGDSDLSIE